MDVNDPQDDAESEIMVSLYCSLQAFESVYDSGMYPRFLESRF